MLSVVLAAWTWCSGAAVADHAVQVELFYGGAWRSAPAYVRDGISISRGAGGEGQDAPPSAASLTLDNRDGTYSPRNPTSALYGLAGRNTPMRVTADGSVRSVTEAASWKPQTSVGRHDAWTAVEGGGILRRLQQGRTPLRGSLPRQMAGLSPVAWWPLTDGRDSDYAASGLPGGTPMTELGAVDWAAVTGPGGDRSPVPQFMTGESYCGSLWAPVNITGEFTIDAWVRFESPGLDNRAIALMWFTTGTAVSQWELEVGTSSFDEVPFFTVSRHLPGSTSATSGDLPIDNDFHRLRVKARQIDPATVGARTYIDDTQIGSESTFAGTLGTLTHVAVGNYGLAFGTDPLNDIPYGVTSLSVAHLSVWDSIDDADLPTYAAGTGYAGETAGERFLRLGVEEGVTTLVDGDETDTQAMGPQPTATLVDLLRECVRTDDGLMCEPRGQLGLTMRPGRSRYNQTAALALSFAAGGQIGPGLAPLLDDQGVRNDVTAQRRDGTSARAVRTSGPLNINDPVDDPQGVGRVDTTVDINTAGDAVVPTHASWHLAKGTQEEPRWPQVTVDLDAAPSLTAAVNAVEIGDVITIDDLPADWATEQVRLLVIGIRETFPGGAGDYRRLVTFVTQPASIFEIGLVGANDGSTDLRGMAVDTDLSTLASGITATATSLSVASTGGVLWSTTASDSNPALNGGGLYVSVGGETMRVTAVTGASSPQTVTVVRSVNGVVKAHSAGTPVHMRYPTRVGL